MRKLLKYGSLVLVLVLLASAGWVAYVTETRRANPDAEALAALESDATVTVTLDQGLDDTVVFRPAGSSPTVGVMVYPGSSCDVRGYAPVMRRIAAAGYQVVGLQMPLNQSVLDPDRAGDVPAAFPEIRQWVLVGHSQGGAMAAQYAHRYPDRLAGLVIWDSFPADASSLANYSRPVWNLYRATPAGEAPESFQRRFPLLPPDTVHVPLKGGIHMYFGSFSGGGYVEKWQPTISRQEQQDQVVQATLDALRTMTASSS